jgi:iron complex outermembrane receptor protein
MDSRKRYLPCSLLLFLANSALAGTPRVLEEVLVTAQKTTQSAQDVPISLTALDGAIMRDIGATGLADMAPYMPNVRFSSESDPALAQINIRGFGSNPLNAAFESSVGFVQDEIFFGRPSYFAEAMFDVDRVEVLRGPQGTLFGKNTIAGVFNVTSIGPSEEFSGNVRLSQSDPDETRIEGGVGGKLTDGLGLRLSGLTTQRDGELYNQFLDRRDDQYEQDALRLKLRFDFAENLSSDLTAVTSETSVNYWGLQLMELDEGTRTFLQNYDPAIEDDPANFTSSYNTPGFLDKTSDTLGLVTRWDIGGWGALDESAAVLVLADSSLTIDSLVDLDASPADIAQLTVVSDYEQQSAEFRFTGSAGGLFGMGDSLDFVAGLFLFESSFEQLTKILVGEHFADYLLSDDALQLASGNSAQTSGGLLGGLNPAALGLVGASGSAAIGEDYYRLDYLLELESQALFAQMTWALNEHWVVTPGIRYNREQKVVDALGQGVCPVASISQPCVMKTALSAEDYQARNLKRSESDMSPKLSLQYYFRESLNSFLTVSKGFKSGGFNASSFGGDDLVFKPEKAVTLELGIKGRFFDNTLRVNAAVYRTEFDDLQVLAFNGAFFDVTNAATAISEGVELDFVWLTPFEPLSLRGSFGLLDARYDNYSNAPAPIDQGVNATQDLSGRTIALAPEQTATLTPTLTVPVFGLGLSASVDVLYQGDQYTDTDLDEATFLAGYTSYSARVSLGAQDQRWALTLGGSNLSDERILNQVLDTVFFPKTYNSRQKAGRKIFLALSFKW